MSWDSQEERKCWFKHLWKYFISKFSLLMLYLRSSSSSHKYTFYFRQHWHDMNFAFLSFFAFIHSQLETFSACSWVCKRLLKKSGGKNRRLQWSVTKISFLEFFYDMTQTFCWWFFSSLIKKISKFNSRKRWRWIMMKQQWVVIN
jgi:hypothetical protein